jgi:hypothetical protein
MCERCLMVVREQVLLLHFWAGGWSRPSRRARQQEEAPPSRALVGSGGRGSGWRASTSIPS